MTSLVPVGYEIEGPPLHIGIELGNVCNYKCQYCFPGSNEGDHTALPAEFYVDAIREIIKRYAFKQSLRYYTIYGGEPTVVPHLTDIVEMIKREDTNGSFIELLTNGSRTVRYWSDISQYIDNINISVHVSSADVDHLVEVCGAIRSKVLFVLMDPTLWDESVNMLFALEALLPDVAVNAKIVRSTSRFESSYTDSQKAFLNSYQSVWNFDPDEPRPPIPSQFMLGSLTVKDVMQLTPKQCSWKGWYCLAGTDTVVINASGNAHSGAGCHAHIFGDASTPASEWNWPSGPVICPKKKCMCDTDRRIRKFKKWTEFGIEFPGP